MDFSTKPISLTEIHSFGGDCIFVGSAGFSNRLKRFVLGSVSAAVAARAHCSVEVVRPKSKTSEDAKQEDG